MLGKVQASMGLHIKTKGKVGKAGLVLAVLQLCGLALAACGDSAITPSTATPKIVLVTTTTAAPTVVVATQPPPPSPTPVPNPNKIVIGDEDSPWAEIVRYEPNPFDKFEDVNVNKEVNNSMAAMFVGAPALVALTKGASFSANTYKLEFSPAIAKGLTSGSLQQMQSLEGGMRAIVVDSTTKQIVGHGSLISTLKPTIGPPYVMVFMLLSGVLLDQFLPGINQQFEILNQNIVDVKNFLEDKEYSIMQGNLKYLNDIRSTMNLHKIAPTDLEAFRNQLESVERESQQITEFYKTRMGRTNDSFNQVKLDKTLLFFRSEDKIKELQKYVTDYQAQSSSYLFALMVRGLSSQVRCALPESRELALGRIEDVRKDLKTLSQTQDAFYTQVEKRIPEMTGMFADSKTQDQFKDLVAKGKAKAKDDYEKADKGLNEVVQKVNAQMLVESQALALVVTLDGKGNITKTAKLVSTKP